MGILFQVAFLVLVLGSLLPQSSPASSNHISLTISPTSSATIEKLTPTASPKTTTTPTAPSKQTKTQGVLPTGGSGEILVGYASPKGGNPYYPAFSPPGVKATVTYSKTGYSTMSTESPSHSFKGLPPGNYLITLSSLPGAYTVSHIVSVYQNGAWSKQSEESGATASMTLLGNGYEQGSVSFIFTPAQGTGSSTNTSDTDAPKVTDVEAPAPIWGGSDRTINQKDFCITIHTSDNVSPESDIENKVILHNLDNHFQQLYNTDWSTQKVSCFNSLTNGSYQLEINVRDKAGNIANYSTQFRVLSS